MAYPTPYELDYDFTAYQVANPLVPLPADKVEIEFNNVATSIDEIITSITAITNSDTTLKNNSVGMAQMRDEVSATLNAASDWATLTAYIANNAVYKDNKVYRCLLAHTSGTFATDLGASKWRLLLNFDTFVSAASTSATAAASSASAAASSATSANSSASSATSSATTATNAATAAAASAALFDTVVTAASSGGARALDLSVGRVFKHSVTENTTFSFTNPAVTGKRCAFEVHLFQDGSGRTITWPTVKWDHGVAPVVNVASTDYVLSFCTIDGGATYSGGLSREAYS